MISTTVALPAPVSILLVLSSLVLINIIIVINYYIIYYIYYIFMADFSVIRLCYQYLVGWDFASRTWQV